jgi:hypothetical protein
MAPRSATLGTSATGGFRVTPVAGQLRLPAASQRSMHGRS